MIGRSHGVIAALALAVSGCAGLPASGPTVNQVLRPLQQGDVDVIEIRPDTVGGDSAAMAPPAPWPIGDALGSNDRVQPGDRVLISVYETGYSLFAGSAPADTGSASPTGSTRTFPPIVVPGDGYIRFPYAGEFDARGMAAQDIAQAIERRLRGKSQFAQVLASVEQGPLRAAVIAGDVTRPGRIPLSPARERLLDAIALSGGPLARKADTLVRLTRGPATGETRLDAIAQGSAENVILAPGDRIELARATRTLTVLGAARSVSEIAFDSAQLTLSEALARAGGAQDDKADATGVFIFRYERRERDGQAVAQPVVYRLNLLDPASYFAAQRFRMAEKDVMLISNARSNQIGKFIQMLNAVTAPIVTVDIIARQ